MESKCEDITSAKFKFGDGKTVCAQKLIHIPLQIAARTVKLKTFVMNGKVSFLLGMEALSKMKAKIDTAANEITICRQKMSGMSNESGHFVLELSVANDPKAEKNECVFQFTDEYESKTKRKQLINRLHMTFRHAHAQQLTKLLEKSENLKEFNNQKISKTEIDEVVKQCKNAKKKAEIIDHATVSKELKCSMTAWPWT